MRLYDRADLPMNFTQNTSNVFYTGAYAATPSQYSWVNMGSRPPTGTNPNYTYWVDAKVLGLAPWDVTGWRIKQGTTVLASGSLAPYFDARIDDSYFDASFSRSSSLPSGNDYALEMDINHTGVTSFTFAKTGISYTHADVQTVDVTSLTPSSNYYFKTSTPTFSWNPVTDTGTRYRLRIFDSLGQSTLWRSGWDTITSVTVPVDVLTPGGTYYWTVQTKQATGDVAPYVNTEGNSGSKVLYRFTLQPPLMGDVSGNGEVNLEDAILALQVVSGFTPAVTLTGDVNADNRIGLQEAIYILQTVSGLR
jgi:hypothetical protein